MLKCKLAYRSKRIRGQFKASIANIVVLCTTYGIYVNLSGSRTRLIGP